MCAMLQREAELRGHPTTQRALDNIELSSQDGFQLCDSAMHDKNNRTIDDEQYEMIFRRVARMKSGELKAQLRQLGLSAKGSTATVRSVGVFVVSASLVRTVQNCLSCWKMQMSRLSTCMLHTGRGC